MDNHLATKGDIHEIIDHVLSSKAELKVENELIKNRLAILEKAVWIVIAGVVVLILRSFLV
jgi:hypothetical protein